MELTTIDVQKIEKDVAEKSHLEKRMTGLVEKAKTAESERDAERAEKEKLASEKTALQKERDFYAGFSKSTSKYPQATDFQDDIKSKVMSGYSVEDATVSVLASKGKLTTAAPERDMVAGGSAPTMPQTGREKPISEMTREEKRAALIEAEKKGEIYIS